jgi:ubiquinone/menaquinone biosynthesis C-methylase UbiE
MPRLPKNRRLISSLHFQSQSFIIGPTANINGGSCGRKIAKQKGKEFIMFREQAFKERLNDSSYRIQTVAGHLETEINRLGAQVELFWAKELKHYREYGLADGMKVVELGSGPGFLTEKLLREFPRLNITGVEIEGELVRLAKERLKKNGFNRFRLLNASIMETGLPGDTYDFAITRLLIEHVADPVAAAREVLRILKPGGKAVFIDNDFEMHLVTSPTIPELRDLYEAYCHARCVEGGNPRIGRDLPVILKHAGYANVDFEIIAAHNEIVGDDIFFKSQCVGIASKLIQDGYLSSKVLGKVSLQWRKLVRDEGHAIVRQLYMGIGEKAI